MFKALINGEILKSAFMGVSVISRDIRMNFSNEEVSVKTVDDANVCMVSLDLKKDAFDYYDATPSVVGLNVKTTYDLLKDAKKDDPIDIEHLEKESKIRFTIGRLSYSMVLLSLDAIKKEPRTPKMDLPVKAIINGEDFRKAIKAAEKVSDYIVFNADNDGLNINSKGEMRDMSLTIPKEDLKEYSRKEEKSVKSMFSLEYVSEIAKVFANAEDIEIMFGNYFPILIKSTVSSSSRPVGFLEYILAPRVEEGY